MRWLSLVGALVVQGAFAGVPWFDVRFDGFAEGEPLSDKGAVGGSWEKVEGAVIGAGASVELRAANMADGVCFAATNATRTSASWTMDFRLNFPFAVYLPAVTPDDAVAFTLADGDDNVEHFGAWVGNAWHVLDGKEKPVTNVWYDVRVEVKTYGDETYVGFSLLSDDDAIRLVDAQGACEFRIDREIAGAVRKIAFTGSGRFGAFNGACDTSASRPLLYWIGGEAGDWSATNCWSLAEDGAPTDHVPGEGEAVKIPGRVAVTRGEESATLTDFLAEVGADGALDMLSGACETPVSLDTTRLLPGVKIAPKARPFGGLVNKLKVAWFRGGVNVNGDKSGLAPFSDATSLEPTENDFESWFRCVCSSGGGEPQTKDFFFSRLPVVYLDTDAGTDPTVDKADFSGTMTAQGNVEFKLGKKFDAAGAMPMTIHVRGNTTAGQPKKPWKVKLDSKTKVFEPAEKGSKAFDVGDSKHWVLLANAMDHSGYRNKLAYDFANEIGNLGMKSTFVTVVMNGTYRGVYQLCEHVRIDKNRVNVYDWEGAGEDAADAVADANGFEKADKKALESQMSEDFGWVTTGTVEYNGVTYALGDYVESFDSITNDITGGYLFSLDGKNDDALTKVNTVATGRLAGLKIQVDGPETLYTNKEMTQWCKDYLQLLFDATTAVDGYKNGLHFSECADLDSMVSYYLSMELCGNYDARANSRYAYKQRGEKLKFGPVWDCDLAFASSGNAWVPSAKDPESWTVLNDNYAFYKEWIDDPAFCERLLNAYWTTARPAFSNMLTKVRGWNEALAKPFAANAVRWKDADAMASERTVLVDYITRRLAWVDRQFVDVPALMSSLADGTGTTPSTHPYEKSAGEAAMPLSFPNATAGRVRSGVPLKVLAAIDDMPEDSALSLYVNGLKVPASFHAVVGGFSTSVSSSMLRLEGEGANVIEVVVCTADGKTVVARNYELVVRDPAFGATLLLLK